MGDGTNGACWNGTSCAISVLADGANAAGGGDIIPAAINFTDVSVTSGSGIETTNEVTFSGLTSPITVRAAWTSTSSSPTKARWYKSGAPVASPALTSIEATIINGDKLRWETYAAYTHPSGNYDSGTVTVTNESRNATCTMTIASPAVVTEAGHGYAAGDKILFRTTGALPTGVTAGQVYFVSATDLATDTFKFSETDGGSVVNTSGSQSGTHTLVSVLDTFTFECQYVRTGVVGDDGVGGGGYNEPPNIN